MCADMRGLSVRSKSSGILHNTLVNCSYSAHAANHFLANSGSDRAVGIAFGILACLTVVAIAGRVYKSKLGMRLEIPRQIQAVFYKDSKCWSCACV